MKASAFGKMIAGLLLVAILVSFLPGCGNEDPAPTGTLSQSNSTENTQSEETLPTEPDFVFDATDAEAVVLMELVNPEDEISVIILKSNGRYEDLVRDYVRGTYQMRNAKKEITLTPDSGKDCGATMIRNEDKTYTYTATDGYTTVLALNTAPEALCAFSGDVPVPGMDGYMADFVCGIYNDGTVNLAATFMGTTAEVDRGTYTVDLANHSISISFETAGDFIATATDGNLILNYYVENVHPFGQIEETLQLKLFTFLGVGEELEKASAQAGGNGSDEKEYPADSPIGSVSLKDIYASKMDIGIADTWSLYQNPEAMELVKNQFSILTPENVMKPEVLMDLAACQKLAATDETAVAVHFDEAKPLLDFASENGIKVHGHTLVWYTQTPEAFFHEGYDENKPYVNREIMLQRLENYIKEVMTYLDTNYPGVVVSWDVANEAIDDGQLFLRESNWTRVVGEDYLSYAFAFARKYAPVGTLLYYNDYVTNTEKLDKIYTLVVSLMEEGNVDGIGNQMHYSANADIQVVSNEMNKMASLGLKMRISELDVSIGEYSQKNLQKQAKLYAQIMRLALKYDKQMEAVQFWGLSDNVSWRAESFPLLFDENLDPKPAFFAVADPENKNNP